MIVFVKAFGVVGIVSILAWAGAILLAVLFARRPWRHRFFLRALGLALLGWGLALINSAAIVAIRPDRSSQDAALPQAEAVSRPGARREKGLVREATTVSESPEPLYKQKGKQKRQLVGAGGAADGAAGGEDPTGEKKIAEPRTRMMPEADVIQANRLDRLNLLAVRSVLLLMLAVNVLEYFRRLNSAFDAVAPLPFSSRWLDVVFPKKHAVAARNAGPDFLRDYAVTAVRKGENFLYLGPTAFPADRLARWHVPAADWLRDFVRVFVPLHRSGPGAPACGALGGMAGGRWVWEARRVTLMTYDETRAPFSLAFVLESLWFDRYAFAAEGLTRSLSLLEALGKFLRERHRPRAAARNTVNVIWDFETPPPAALLTELAPLCRETNFRLVVRLVRDLAPRGPDSPRGRDDGGNVNEGEAPATGDATSLRAGATAGAAGLRSEAAAGAAGLAVFEEVRRPDA